LGSPTTLTYFLTTFMIRGSVAEYLKKTPVIFPLAAVFHCLWLVWLIWSDRREPFPDEVWLQVLWMVLFTLCWVWAAGMSKKGAAGYILLTVADVVIYLLARNHLVAVTAVFPIFPVDVLMSMALLFYFGKLS